MKKIKLINFSKLSQNNISDHFLPFTLYGYTFYSKIPASNDLAYIYTSNMALRENRKNCQNAYVEFNHRQDDSIIYKWGRIGRKHNLTFKRKFLDDILLLGSLLIGKNLTLYSRRFCNTYPILASNNLRTISENSIELQNDLTQLIKKIKDKSWQEKFDSGFHLIMLLNSSNNHNIESRFLSEVVLWEYLYCKIFGKECEKLQKIMKDILMYFWQDKVDTSVFLENKYQNISKNIFYVLRNQLAHSGRLPIDRPYAEQWMKQVPLDYTVGSVEKGIRDYLRFFDELTQVIVMKTMDFHPEERQVFNSFGFNDNLKNFLSKGKL